MRIRIQKKNFTLIELIAAMGVFSIIMFLLISFFSSAQSIWNLTRQKNAMYENARISLELMARDIQCIYYEYEKIPFYHYPGTGAVNDTEALYFVSATNVLPNYDYNTRLCEIAYKFYNQDVSTAGAWTGHGWLVRSVTGDDKTTPNAAWNYYGKPMEKQAVETPPLGKVYDASDSSFAFTQNSNSRDVFNTVIPNVVNLSFKCFKNDGSLIDPADISANYRNSKMIPYSIMIELTLLDRESWLKWKAVGGSPADPLLLNNRRVFSRTVLIGERGQKY